MNHTLRKARTTRGYTQNALAKEIGVTDRAYRNYERGTQVPSIWKALDLQDALGIPVQQLFTREDRHDGQTLNRGKDAG